MFVWIYPLAPSRQQNLKKGTSLNEQLNIVIRKGDYGGPVRSPDIRVQIPSWALGCGLFLRFQDQDGESAVT